MALPMMLRISIALAGVLMVSSLFLFVLPGYYLFLVADYPLGHLLGPFHGDYWLPIAMQLQLLWPPVLPVAVWAAGKIVGGKAAPGPRRIALQVMVSTLMAYLWAVALASWLHWQALNP